MKEFEIHYLRKSYEIIQRWLTMPWEELYTRWVAYPETYMVEQVDTYIYCLFTYIDSDGLEEIILFVFEGDTIIADLSALHVSMHAFMNDQVIYDACSEESDWMYLEHYVLCSMVYPEEPYPYCEHMEKEFEGECILYRNAYVTRSYRRQGIFSTMLSLCSEYIASLQQSSFTCYSIMSLDMDIACYGPDTVKEPYIYSFDKDEPVRMLNKAILEKKGFYCLRLEADHDDEDGTKLWFGIKKESDILMDITHES